MSGAVPTVRQRFGIVGGGLAGLDLTEDVLQLGPAGDPVLPRKGGSTRSTNWLVRRSWTDVSSFAFKSNNFRPASSARALPG